MKIQKVSIFAIASGLLLASLPVMAANTGGTFSLPSAPAAAPTPVFAPAPTAPTPQAASVVIVQPQVFVNDQVQPKDTTSNAFMLKTPTTGSSSALNGVQELPDTSFLPNKRSHGDNVLAFGDAGTKFAKTSSTTVKLEEGTILVSVRTPTNFATINTPDGDIALSANSDILVSFIGDVLKVNNISAQGTRCRIKLHPGVMDGKAHTLALGAGFELTASDHQLQNGQIAAPDGIARRGSATIAAGNVAVSQFWVNSLLASNPIIATVITGDNRDATHRVDQMCKIASVLDYIYGTDGYKSAGSAGVAATPGAITH